MEYVVKSPPGVKRVFYLSEIQKSLKFQQIGSPKGLRLHCLIALRSSEQGRKFAVSLKADIETKIYTLVLDEFQVEIRRNTLEQWKEFRMDLGYFNNIIWWHVCVFCGQKSCCIPVGTQWAENGFRSPRSSLMFLNLCREEIKNEDQYSTHS